MIQLDDNVTFSLSLPSPFIIKCIHVSHEFVHLARLVTS